MPYSYIEQSNTYWYNDFLIVKKPSSLSAICSLQLAISSVIEQSPQFANENIVRPLRRGIRVGENFARYDDTISVNVAVDLAVAIFWAASARYTAAGRTEDISFCNLNYQ